VGFKPTFLVCEWPQTFALDHATTGTVILYVCVCVYSYIYCVHTKWLVVKAGS
jgi:hypothetical protein